MRREQPLEAAIARAEHRSFNVLDLSAQAEEFESQSFIFPQQTVHLALKIFDACAVCGAAHFVAADRRVVVAFLFYVHGWSSVLPLPRMRIESLIHLFVLSHGVGGARMPTDGVERAGLRPAILETA
jgi:hypothetical protein